LTDAIANLDMMMGLIAKVEEHFRPD